MIHHVRPIDIWSPQFTSQAYEERTGRKCWPLSFQEVADGKLPESTSELCGSPASKPGTAQLMFNLTRTEHVLDGIDAGDREESRETGAEAPTLEMVICSFALHLLEDPSQTFALLWELSRKASWLIVIAPHKKPEVLPYFFQLSL